MSGSSAPLHHESLEAAGASDLLRLFLSFSLCFPFVVFLLNVKDFFRLALPPPSPVCLFFCFSWKRVGHARRALPAPRSAARRYPRLPAPSSCQSLPAGRSGWADSRKPHFLFPWSFCSSTRQESWWLCRRAAPPQYAGDGGSTGCRVLHVAFFPAAGSQLHKPNEALPCRLQRKLLKNFSFEVVSGPCSVGLAAEGSWVHRKPPVPADAQGTA